MDIAINENNPFAAEMRAAMLENEENLHRETLRESLNIRYEDLMNLAVMEITNNYEMELLEQSNDTELVFALTDDEYLETFEKEFNIDADLDTSKFAKNPAIKLPMEEYLKKLTKVNDYVYKKIKSEGIGEVVDLVNHKVVFEYSLFLGKNEEPFDSNEISHRYEVIHFDKDLLPLPGIIEAVETMKYREESVFWLSHEVMYGRLGIINRIPPQCDIIARFKIIKLFDNEGNEIKLEMSRFEKAKKKAEKGYENARNAFQTQNYDMAIRIYNKYINLLEKTHLANDREEQHVKDYLIKMYLELALCYNKIKNPQRTCIAIRELEKLQSISGNVKALFAKGKALMMLNDFKQARKFYQKALKLEPEGRKIKAAIKNLDECETAKTTFATEKNQRENQFKREVDELNFPPVNPMVERYLKTLDTNYTEQ